MRRLFLPAKIGVALLAFLATFVALTAAAAAAGPESWGRPLLLLVGYPCE